MKHTPINRVRLLDYGYIGLVESWGSDEGIIEAARMSSNKGFLGWDPSPDNPKGDMHLLRYLQENKHETPFEMAGLQFEVQLPLYVRSEWHRHRTQSYNEMSARYVPLPDFNYLPTMERVFLNGKTKNKQAGAAEGALELTEEFYHEGAQRQLAAFNLAEESYQWCLKHGWPKELARGPVPVARYTRMRAQANLRNWLGFMTLRTHPAAQWEIRQYAIEVGKAIATTFPRTWELFAVTMEPRRTEARRVKFTEILERFHGMNDFPFGSLVDELLKVK